MTTPILSVVVPFHNVAHYLQECLASIAGGSLTDLEVIMVDDGSTDGSADIASAVAEADPRFRLLSIDHVGVGPARNAGVAAARAEFLAFADSDDLLPPAAYKLMVDSLQETGSDLASGAVQRFTSVDVWDSPLHAGVFSETRQRTHISRSPELINDRTVWNKVIRRRFWLEHKLAFPDQLYEDGPAMVPAHVHARQVDLLSDTVYMWRRREAGDLSITQRVWEYANVRDRLRQVFTLTRFLTAHCPSLRPVYDRSALAHDLLIVLLTLEKLDPDEQRLILGQLREHLDRIPPAILADVPEWRWSRPMLSQPDFGSRVAADLAGLRIEELL